MEQTIYKQIQEERLIQPNSHVLVAVSGGPDSLALLHFLWQHQQRLAITLSVITVDHQLRGASSVEDAQFVANVCKDWQIPCAVVSVDVKSYQSTHRVGTQLAARELRYEAFHQQMMKEKADYLALGHHADDQIETMVMAMLKSTHIHNMGGISRSRPFACGALIRPFLQVEKAHIVVYTKRHGLTPQIDATNLEKNYTRNRIRADIIPLLKKENPSITTTMGKLALHIQEDSAFLESQAKTIFEECVQLTYTPKVAHVNIDCILSCAVSLQRRVFRLTLDYLYDMVPTYISYKHEEMFLSLLHQERNRVVHFPSGLYVERAYDTVYMYFQNQDGAVHNDVHIEELPFTTSLWNGMHLSCKIINDVKAEIPTSGQYTYIAVASALTLPLIVRTRKPGDRMKYDGLEGTKKLQRIFMDEKIPRHKRSHWPILTDGTGRILWVIGVKKDTIQDVGDDEAYIYIHLAHEYSEEEANDAPRD